MSRGSRRAPGPGRLRGLGWIVLVAACLALGGCAILRNVHAEADRKHDVDEYAESDHGPDAMVDRLGDPDEWKNHKDGDQLLMTAIWYCVEGEYREITWESRVQQRGTQYWAIVNDISRECEQKSK